jgi:hypothetical protein
MTGNEPSPDLTALLDTVALLWPDHPSPRVPGTPVVTRESPLTTGTTFLVVPNATHPRLLVPAAPAAAARALRRYSSALGPRDTALRSVAALGMRAGGSMAFRDRITVDPSDDSIGTLLEQVLGEPVVCSLGVGTDRANRKPVLQVLSTDGRCLAFAKIGINDYTGALIAGEHRTLERLASIALPPRLDIPRVLWSGNWHGHPVLVLSPLEPSAGSVVRPRGTPVPHDVMHDFAACFLEPSAPLPHTALWERATLVRDTVTDARRREAYAAALDAVEEVTAHVPVPVGAWHGDWTPWNMGHRGHRLLLWDWERFETGVPVGMDAIHFAVQTRNRRSGFSASSVQRGLEDAHRPLRLAPGPAAATTAAYLVAITGRALESVEQHGGRPADTLADLLLDALRTWSTDGPRRRGTTGAVPNASMDALRTAVGELWPPGDDPASDGSVDDLLVIPNLTAPRLLVPARPAAAGATALRRYSSALGVREAATRLAVSGLLRLGGGGAIGDRLGRPDAGDSIERHLAGILGEPVVCSVGVGTDRANQKPVLQIFDRRGRSLAFAKVGMTPFTERLVAAEHQHLLTLAAHRLPTYLRVPQVIACSRWRGLLVLVLSDLSPSVTATVRWGDVPAPRRAMDDLARSFPADPLPWIATVLGQEARRIAEALPPGADTDQFGAALEVVEAYVGPDPVELGAWHGDWTPWNMAHRGRRLLLWDWERFAVGVPLGLDPLHYDVYARCRRDGFTSTAVLAGLAEAGHPRDVDDPRRSVVAATYLTTLAGRSLEGAARQPSAGAASSAGTALAALRAWTRT